MSFDSPSGYAFSPYAIPTAATALAMLAFGMTVLVRRRSRLSVIFFVMTLAVAVWMTAFTFMYASRDASTAILWARIAYLGVPFIAPAIYNFTVEMLRIAERRRLAVATAWGLASFFSALGLFSNLLLTGVSRYWWGWSPRYGVAASIPFLLFFFGWLVCAMIEFLAAYPKLRPAEKPALHLLAIGFGVAYLGCVDFLPKFGLEVYPFGYLPIAAFAAILGLSMRRHDLMSIDPALASREIIGTMADALFVCDDQGALRFANRAAEELLGYELRDLAGKNINDFIAYREGEDREPWRRAVRNVEHVFVTHSGERIDLLLSAAPMQHHGENTGAILIGRDIRELKRAEREVLQAVTLLRSTLDSTTDGILVVGDSGRVHSYNQRFVEMWRLTQNVMDSADDRVLVDHVLDQLSDPEEFVRTIESLYTQPDAESFSVLTFKDGRRFERYSIGRRIEGGPNIRVWSFRDVTSSFTAEAALRESEMRYRLLFEQNAAGVCLTKYDGTILDCNTTFAVMLRHKRLQLIGRNAGELYERPIERDELADMLRDVTTLKSVEVQLRRSDGERVWVLQNLTLVGEGEESVIHTTVVDISDRKRAEEQIEFHAYHDVLTHLPNRKLFTDRLRQSLTRCKRSGKALSVMFIDLDHFKMINDTLGHTAGDELLLEMSRRLRGCIREDDTVARLGGDEFTIILSELRHPEDAVTVAEKILDAVKRTLMISGMPVEMTASIGIAVFPEDGRDPESLLRNADSAMYRAKESGRNTYQLCTDEMKQRAIERLSLEVRLRRAVPEDQLVLYYQPQVSLVTGRVIGAEALVRWNDPARGLVEPDAFIPIAEETRLIVPMGEWIIRTACKQAKDWHDAGAAIRVCVNLSARQFQQHNLVDVVRRAICDVRVDPAAIELEITETTAMQNGDVTTEILLALREIGVGISIDDFGTGYSSLSYLKRFPITAVKIDRSFIRDMIENEGNSAIVTAVIAIARSLKLRVIAEGVETEEQFKYLQRRQCDEAQGFYFSRPIPAERLTALFEEPLQMYQKPPRLTM